MQGSSFLPLIGPNPRELLEPLLNEPIKREIKNILSPLKACTPHIKTGQQAASYKFTLTSKG